MSVMAAGTVNMKMKQAVPGEIIDLMHKKYIHVSFRNLDYVVEFDGNWHLDAVIDEIEPLNPYIESGSITYWSDEGEAIAEFHDGMWCEEWQEHYYPSELPNAEVSLTERVAKILNIVATDLMECSDSEAAVQLLFRKCKLTSDEIKLYGLSWLKDLDTAAEEEEDWSEEDCLEWKKIAER